MMKHLRYFSLLLLLAVASVGWAEETTLTAKALEGNYVYYDNYTLTLTKGTGSTAPSYNQTAKDLRVYANGIVKISTTGNSMTKIVFNISTNGLKRLAPITASTGTIATQTKGDGTVTWTGDATEVSFTVGEKATYGSDGASKAGQLCFSSVVVTSKDENSGPVDPTVQFASDPFEVEVNATATNEITKPGDLTVAYSISPASGVATIDATTGAVTGVAEGTATVTATWEAVADKYNAGSKSYALNVVAAAEPIDGELFHETFDKIDGKGGRDNSYTGQIATNAFVVDGKSLTDESDWTFDKCNGASKCAKYGSSSADGTLTTRSIALNGDGTLTFSAAGWGSGSNSLKVTATGGTLSGDVDITLTNSSWKDYTVAVSGATGNLVLTFKGKRGFIDDIVVKAAAEGDKANAGLSFSETSFTVALDETDTFEAPTLTTAEGFDGTVKYSSSNEELAIVDENTGEVLLFDDAEGTVTITASSAETDNFKAGEASYTVTLVKKYTVGEFKAAADETVGMLVFNDTYVTYVNGQNIYVQDGTGAIDLYASGLSGATVGKVLNGYLMAKKTTFNMLPEVTTVTKNAVVISDAETPAEPAEIDIADLDLATNVCEYVVLSGSYKKSGNDHFVSDGTDDIQIYNQLKDSEVNALLGVLANNDEITVTGVFTVYNNELELYITKLQAGTEQIVIKDGFSGTTFSCDKPLDFTEVEGLTAYIITDADCTTEKVGAVPANTGLYLEGAAKTYEVPVVAPSAIVEGNILIPTDGSSVQSDDATTYYAYGRKNGKEAFFKVSKTKAWTPSANKALLAISTASAAGRDMIEVNGGTTGIALESNDGSAADEAVYNLAGQRVAKAQKGVYIVGGRKVVVK